MHEAAQSQKGVGADIFGLLKTAGREMDDIAAIGAPPVCKFFSEDWDKNGGIGIFPTGIPFFDALLNGGHAPGEVYGLLGPLRLLQDDVGDDAVRRGLPSGPRHPSVHWGMPVCVFGELRGPAQNTNCGSVVFPMPPKSTGNRWIRWIRCWD